MRIISLCGLLGYGYSEDSFRAAMEKKPDYIGVDAGSSDPGPYYLGAGVRSLTAPRFYATFQSHCLWLSKTEFRL